MAGAEAVSEKSPYKLVGLNSREARGDCGLRPKKGKKKGKVELHVGFSHGYFRSTNNRVR